MKAAAALRLAPQNDSFLGRSYQESGANFSSGSKVACRSLGAVRMLTSVWFLELDPKKHSKEI